jgi:hypothetical protein
MATMPEIMLAKPIAVGKINRLAAEGEDVLQELSRTASGFTEWLTRCYSVLHVSPMITLSSWSSGVSQSRSLMTITLA